MRAILRSCLVWFVGYPLSVLGATGVLIIAVWLPEVRTATLGDDLWLLARRIIIAAPVVAAFSFLPAALTKPSVRILSYVASGARTGAWCGVLATSAFYVVLFCAAAQQAYRWLMSGTFAEGAPSVLSGSAVFLIATVLLFSAAGAAGGLVFGLFAAGAERPRQFSSWYVLSLRLSFADGEEHRRIRLPSAGGGRVRRTPFRCKGARHPVERQRPL